MNLRHIASRVLPADVYTRLSRSNIAIRLARGSLWALVDALGMKIGTLAQSILLARILGITGFGEWAILLSSTALLAMIGNFGLLTTVTTHVARWWVVAPERLGHLLALVQLLSVFTGLIAFAGLFTFGPTIADQLFDAPQLGNALIVVGVVAFLTACTGLYDGVLKGLEQFRLSAAIHCISTAVSVPLTVLLAYFYGTEGAVFGLLAATCLTSCLLAFYAHKVLRHRHITLCFSECWREYGAIHRTALPIVLAGVMVLGSIWIAQSALVRTSVGFREMGAYQAATQWRTLIVFLPAKLLAAYLPVMSSLAVSSRHQLKRWQTFTLLTVMGATTIIALVAIACSPLVLRLYGSDFTGYTLLFAVSCLIAIADVTHSLMLKTAVIQGYAWSLLVSNTGMVIAVGIGLTWLIPQFMGLGLALTVLLGFILRIAIQYLFFLRIGCRPMSS